MHSMLLAGRPPYRLSLMKNIVKWIGLHHGGQHKQLVVQVLGTMIWSWSYKRVGSNKLHTFRRKKILCPFWAFSFHGFPIRFLSLDGKLHEYIPPLTMYTKSDWQAEPHSQVEGPFRQHELPLPLNSSSIKTILPLFLVTKFPHKYPWRYSWHPVS